MTLYRRGNTIPAANTYCPYTYLIGWTKLNVWYYGVRWATKTKSLYKAGCHPDELFTTYFTSSRIVKRYINKHGLPDVIQVRQVFSSIPRSLAWEHKVLRRMKVTTNKKWLNTSTGGVTRTKSAKGKAIHSHEHIENLRNGWTGENNPNFQRDFSNDHRQKLRKAKLGRKQSAEIIAKRFANHETEKHHRFDSTIYVFGHPEHGTFEGTKHALRTSFPNISHAHLSSLCSGKRKVHRGWTLIS